MLLSRSFIVAIASLTVLLVAILAWHMRLVTSEVGFEDVYDASLPPLQPTLREVFTLNQVTRAGVKTWITAENWASPPSLYNYGLPSFIFPKVGLPVGGHPIGHDLISLLGTQLQLQHSGQGHKLRYLEIGVSVGKCLFTQLQYFGSRAQIVAFDVEEINPTFAAMLAPSNPAVIDSWTEEQLKPGVLTQRRAPEHFHIDTIKAFVSPAGGELHYLAADEFNEVGWQKLRSLSSDPFSLVYSDAFHTPEALLYEAGKLLQLRLLNTKGFALVWDDCDGTMVSQAVCPIVELLRKAQPKGDPRVHFARYRMGGWVGVHEEEHGTCVATTLDLPELRARDADFARLPRFHACS